MKTREERYWIALVNIIQVLGPRKIVPFACMNKCEGCQYEMVEAVRLARKALGRQRPGWMRKPGRKKR